MNPTKKNAQVILETESGIVQTSNGFIVRSLSDPSKTYNVHGTGNGLACTCVEYTKSKTDCQHIVAGLEKIKSLGKGFKIMQRSKFNQCKICKSGNLVKSGLDKTKKHQTFKCKECGVRFIPNPGFEKMRFEPALITRALRMYYNGMSVRGIEDCYEQEGIKVSYRTIYNWVDKYSKMTATYLDGIIPNVGDWFRADEIYIVVKGKMAYLFASMDDDTRFWLAGEMAASKVKHNADNLLRMTKMQAGKVPRIFITDKLPAYAKSCIRVFGQKVTHISNAGIRSKRINRLGRESKKNYHPSNNKMERLNGAIRHREKTFRGLKKMDTAIIDGMRINHNFIKKHGSLDGQTPSEAAGIYIEGDDKWMTAIQNAALNQATV